MALRRTVAQQVAVDGIALHAGVPVSMRIAPAAPGTGIVFSRNDIPGNPTISANWENVVQSRFATVIGEGRATVAVTEHLLAALAGLDIDDCLIELNGPEPPLLDGDALSFVRLLDTAGIREVDAPRHEIRVLRRVEAESGTAAARLIPAVEPEYHFEIDFPDSAIGHQSFSFRLTEVLFRQEIAPARTFGFLKDGELLRKQGFARGATFENTLVIDGGRLCNPDKQRFPDEFVRHKILDAIGDMKLAGAQLIARFEGRRSSHALNIALIRSLFADPENYAMNAL